MSSSPSSVPAWLALLLVVEGCGTTEPVAPTGRDGSAPTPGLPPGLDGGHAGPAPGAGPFDSPVDTWTFVPVEGTRCGNGTPTGIGVNRAASSRDLVILMQGGGACWDGSTCFTLKTAVNVELTYDAAAFRKDFAPASAPVSRDPTNPFSSASAVFIPYCTGDLHGGDVIRTYEVGGVSRTMHHVGAQNLDAVLARLQSAFPTPGTVWVVGTSAGGYGATLGLQAISTAFPGAQVHMLADCSPLVTPAGDRWATWQSAWHLRLPEGCTDCSTRFAAAIDTLTLEAPARRIGLLAYAADPTITQFFGLDTAGYQGALATLVAGSYERPNAHAFVAPGAAHVMLDKVASTTASDGTPLSNWLAGWALGLPGWRTAR